MPKIINYTVYSYDELPEPIKEKARENLGDINVDHEWYRFAVDEYCVDLAKTGFPDSKIHFTGFWSQGDGACFICKEVDLIKWIKFNKSGNEFRTILRCLENSSYLSAEIRSIDSHYCHENSVDIFIEAQYTGSDPEVEKRFFNQVECLERSIRADVRSRSREIYKNLENEYTYLTSKEAIEETIEANEYLFHSDGNLISHPWEIQTTE